MKKFFVVPHSHLDREWYRTFQENRIKLVRFMDDLLETMDADEEYTCYNLDAQTSFIDDYFAIKPENERRFRHHVTEGRLPIGPWYVQPDEHLPTAEGMIRNLLISKGISDGYADYNRVGYVPDSFGQSAVFPTLMKGFGVDSAILYRGFGEEDSRYNDFIWEGLDGSRLIANWMPVGYGNAMFLCEDLEKNVRVVEENIELLEERSISENYLLMCGSDQSFIKKFLPAAIRELNEYYESRGQEYVFVLATLSDYIDAIRPYAKRMEIVRGELRKGKRSRTHNSIGATRMDIKQKNFRIERKYLDQLEPLAAFGSLQGMERDGALIGRGWKYIVENHAHDSICCCCTDAIHEEILSRMVYAGQLADALIKEKLEGLHERIRYGEGKGRPLLVFSTCLASRTQVIEAEVYVKDKTFAIFDGQGREVEYEVLSCERFNLKDTKVSFTPIPDDWYDKTRIRLRCAASGYGYETLYLREGVPATREALKAREREKLPEQEAKRVASMVQSELPEKRTASMVQGEMLDNGLIAVWAEADGSFTIADRESGRVFRNQHILEDDGNAGDEYDYSPSLHDYVVTSQGALEKRRVLEDTPLGASMEFCYRMRIPETTTREARSEALRALDVITVVTLRKEEKLVYFTTRIENRAKNHRLQVHFDGGALLSTHVADIQLGEIERENDFALTKESEQSWHERYYPVFDNHKYSGLKDKEGNGFVILNKGLPQYEIYQRETTHLALTLISCVGAMGNIDLKYRPGRRSGSADLTPASQMQGTFTCEYAFMPVDQETDYIQAAQSYVNPIRAVSFPEYSHDGSLPDSLALFGSTDGLQVSAFKDAENQRGTILRLLNPYPFAKKDVTLTVNRHLFKAAVCTDLAEREIPCKEVKIGKKNNPDGSAKAVFGGEITISEIRRNALVSLRLES